MRTQSELIRYILTGGLTTATNYALYSILLLMNVDYLIANSIAWLGAVLVSYMANRLWVFRSHGNILKELFSFTAARLLTFAVETAGLWMFVSKLHFPKMHAKILVSVVTVIGNYILCKYKIFVKEGVRHG